VVASTSRIGQALHCGGTARSSSMTHQTFWNGIHRTVYHSCRMGGRVRQSPPVRAVVRFRLSHERRRSSFPGSKLNEHAPPLSVSITPRHIADRGLHRAAAAVNRLDYLY